MPSLNINYIKILGCGSSQGVPKIDGSWGQCKKNSKNNRTRCSIYIKVNDLNFTSRYGAGIGTNTAALNVSGAGTIPKTATEEWNAPFSATETITITY